MHSPSEFIKIDLGSATSIDSSRRDPLNYVAEHRSILHTHILSYKITKTSTTPVLVSHSKQVTHSPKREFRFYCVIPVACCGPNSPGTLYGSAQIKPIIFK